APKRCDAEGLRRVGRSVPFERIRRGRHSFLRRADRQIVPSSRHLNTSGSEPAGCNRPLLAQPDTSEEGCFYLLAPGSSRYRRPFYYRCVVFWYAAWTKDLKI